MLYHLLQSLFLTVKEHSSYLLCSYTLTARTARGGVVFAGCLLAVTDRTALPRVQGLMAGRRG